MLCASDCCSCSPRGILNARPWPHFPSCLSVWEKEYLRCSLWKFVLRGVSEILAAVRKLGGRAQDLCSCLFHMLFLVVFNF